MGLWYTPARIVIERFQFVLSWLRTHPLTVTILLFLLASLISIYSAEIKQFLHHWPRTRIGFLSSRRRIADNDLRLLIRLHNNTYELVRYLAWAVVDAIVSGVFLVAPVVVALWFGGDRSSGHFTWPWLAGFWFSQAREVRRNLRRLANYDASVKKLELKIQDLDSKISAATKLRGK